MMFNAKLKREKVELELEVERLKLRLSNTDEEGTLKAEIRVLKDDLCGLKSKKKIEEEDIKHMVKMSQEKNELKIQKRFMECEQEKNNEIAKVKDTYRDKLEERLQKEVESIKEMYGQILERLPNVTARLKGDI